MDFGWSDDQIALRDAVISFARSELSLPPPDGQASANYVRRVWTRCADFGILGLPFSEQYGGLNIGPVSTALVMESLGYACPDAGLVFALGAQLWSVQMPIYTFGSDEQKQLYLPRLCKGEIIGAHAMSEPHSGSDAFALKATATYDGRCYRLNGIKTFVTNASHADLFLIFANTNPDQGFFGITAFLVERGTSGLIVGPPFKKMGLSTADLAEVQMTDCCVEESSRLGRAGQGAMIFHDSMEWERALILAGQVGMMARQLEETVEYANLRRQFGRPIGKFQAISHKIAEMKLRLETSRLHLYRAAWLKERGQKGEAASALAKLYISEAAVQSALDAIQVRGGYGYMTETGVEAALRDAIGGRIFSGTSEVLRNLIAYELGL